jgi:polyisoprenoid-binding protein YceI
MIRRILPLTLSLAAMFALGQGQEATLNFAPAETAIKFTLGDVLHTVHGNFNLKSGQIHFVPTSNAISGEIVVDATTGNSGSSARDRRMHREILESARYSEVIFHQTELRGKSWLGVLRRYKSTASSAFTAPSTRSLCRRRSNSRRTTGV